MDWLVVHTYEAGTRKVQPLHRTTVTTSRRQSFTELQGCAIPKEVRIFLVEYCILSGVCLFFNLELRKEKSDGLPPPAAVL